MGLFSVIASVFLILLNVSCTYSSPVVLNDMNFDQEIKHGTWFVKFYAPWCGHCKKLAPVFDGLTSHPEIKSTNTRIGKVDCTTNRNICERLSVQSYPTLKVIDGGRFFDYAGRREAADMVKFAIEGFKDKPYERLLSQADFVSHRAAVAAEQAEVERKSSVVSITSQSFETLVEKGSDSWIIKFYAPWCGHCKRLAPIWHKLSIALEESGSSTKVAKVDCTVHRRVCSRFNVNGYPSLFYVTDGKVYKYQGPRSLISFVEFVKTDWKSAESIGPIPSETLLSKIVDSGMEWAAKHTVMAILVGILLIAISVAILVALLDYCLGDEELQSHSKEALSSKKSEKLVKGEYKAD